MYVHILLITLVAIYSCMFWECLTWYRIARRFDVVRPGRRYLLLTVATGVTLASVVFVAIYQTTVVMG